MTPSNRPDASPEAVAAGFVFHALVPAAGRGERFGGDVPKQFLEVAGRPLLAWTVMRLLDCGAASVVVALPEEEVAGGAARVVSDPRVRYIAGGATRQASVAAALEASPAAADQLVAVHDGARAAVAAEDVAATVRAAAKADGAVLGRRLTDTLKRVSDGRVIETVDRAPFFRAETPQVFRRATLERAIEAARQGRFLATDEAALVERLGDVTIRAVEARRPNPKVTWAWDLERVAHLVTAEGEWR